MDGLSLESLSRETVEARLRAGLARTTRGRDGALGDDAAEPLSPRLAQLRASLSVAEQQAHVGLVLPGFRRLPGWKRRLAQLAARGVLKVGQVITVYQRQFNLLLVQTLRGLVGQAAAQERQCERLAARIERLEQILAQTQLSASEADQTLAVPDSPVPAGSAVNTPRASLAAAVVPPASAETQADPISTWKACA